MMKLSLQKISQDKILCEVGSGGDGKGMEAVLDANILGEDNSCMLDCGIFVDRKEFRKSGGLGANKIKLRIQEFNKNSKIESDIWKRLGSGEMMNTRVNYG